MITHREVIRTARQLAKDALEHWMYEVGGDASVSEILDYYCIEDLDKYAADFLLQYGIHWDYTDWNTDFIDEVETYIWNYFEPRED